MSRIVDAIRALLKDPTTGKYLIPYVDVAEAAKNDKDGNEITATYATKKELSELAVSSHTHEIADIKDLQAALDGKAAASHTHSYLPLSGGTVSGNLTVTGTLKGATVQATSDKRLKTEIQSVFFNLSGITSYRYRLKSDGAYHVGLIAQEVEKVIPEAVSEDENGMKALDYNAVVAALVDEVNRLKVRLSVLEKNL